MSPLGIESLLAAAYLGATDETAESIRLALGYFPNSHDKIKSAFKIILTELQKCDRFLLVIFNKIYIGNTKCKDDIKKLFKEVFNAHLENIDFSRPDEASDIINACCTEDSQSGRRNLIKIDKLSHKTSAIFVDSLLFAAFWRKQLQSFFTTKKHFYKSENEAVLVDMMHITSLYNYCESRQLNARFLEMSFNDQNVCMIFVVPLKTDGIADLENQLELVFDPPEFKMERVNVVLPKFQISNILYLKEVLQKVCLWKYLRD
jgi:serine protease inhibitor